MQQYSKSMHSSGLAGTDEVVPPFSVSTVPLRGHDGGQLRDKIPKILTFLHNAWHDTIDGVLRYVIRR